MISVENFYWILYENLLKHSGLDCWYYYPFGTKDKISSRGEFRAPVPKKEHHVLFHFDQEPLWSEDLGEIYDIELGWHSWSNKKVKILANSEKSLIKKKIYRDRGILDWYFFYHGFASLNWFRDGQFIDNQEEITNVFLSFNHLVKNYRSYRISLLARLIDVDILDKGLISFHGTVKDCLDEITDPYTLIPMKSQNLISKNISQKIHLPIQLDKRIIDGNSSAHFGHWEFKIWQKSFLHLVNETVFYEPKLHLTEKTFKPIVASRPFFLVAAPGNLAYLRSYGFETFRNWWDESYDEINDPDQRLDAIMTELVKLCQKPLNELKEMLADMQPVLEHNKQHFFGEFRKIITNELVDNFDQCLCIWNNGRVDGRELLRHPDLESVKKLLLR